MLSSTVEKINDQEKFKLEYKMPYVLKISLLENFCRALAEIFCNWKYVSTKFFDDDFIDYEIFGHEIL